MPFFLDRIKSLFGHNKPQLSYNKAKTIASDQNPEVRIELAERQDLKPEILYFLAEDPDPTVRRTIAKNKATPLKADAVLARDVDVEVRSLLAEKIARLAPGLNSVEREDVRNLTLEILEQLARDQAPKVRQILAEALKDVADASPSVIRQLAQDEDLIVSVPVLENSPILTDEDLLQIISNVPKSGALSAISRRNFISVGVADAIVDTESKPAISDLLNNENAQIREETLNFLVDRSRTITTWQEPLVRRPVLPISATLRLAEFVADKYLHILEARSDLDSATLKRVKEEVHRRIGKKNPAIEVDDNLIPIGSENVSITLASVRRLQREGKLEATDIEAALKSGNLQFVRSALAVKSELSVAIVDKIIAARSAKGMMAIAWKAGLPMRLATDLQSNLVGISGSDLINSRNGFDYPITEEELMRELALFTG